jgi:hypothetical protein
MRVSQDAPAENLHELLVAARLAVHRHVLRHLQIELPDDVSECDDYVLPQ